MQKNKTVALCVASLLVLASVPLYTSHAFPSENVNAWKLIEIAQDAYEQVEYIVEQARFRGENVTLAELLIDQGRGLLIQARNNHTVGDYRLALENAKMAQLRFREALQVCTYDEAENECEVGCGLLVAIGQARERIQRLRDIV
ncbi:MAG: hypothetical protein QXF26_00965, partial [Candidatus Bathyarchaeia archaeon]